MALSHVSLSVDGSRDRGAAGSRVSREGLAMKKRSRKTNLAQGLGVALICLQIIHELLDILSKVVNYDRPIWKHRISL